MLIINSLIYSQIYKLECWDKLTYRMQYSLLGRISTGWAIWGLVAILTFPSAVSAHGDEDHGYFTGLFSSAAIKGYDPVAYFIQSKAVKGSAHYRYEYQGAEWRFSSENNLQLFKANPDKYIPQYNGYCAYAMSVYGDKVNVDPTQYVIKDNKLYLNFNAKYNQEFRSDLNTHIKNADSNWQTKFAH